MTDLKGPRDDRWYLSLMSPNTKGPKFAWLAFINSSDRPQMDAALDFGSRWTH